MDFRQELVRSSKTKFKHLTLPDGKQLSIQASEFHYSEPRQTLSDPYKYTHWELLVLDPSDKEGLMDVQPYVPTELVQQLYDQLISANP